MIFPWQGLNGLFIVFLFSIDLYVTRGTEYMYEYMAAKITLHVEHVHYPTSRSESDFIITISVCRLETNALRYRVTGRTNQVILACWQLGMLESGVVYIGSS